jgi:hypothetical protein
MKKKYKILLFILGLVIALVGLVWYSFAQAKKTVEEYLLALREDRLEQAYSYTAKSYQEDTSLEEFSNYLVYYPILASQVSAELGLREYIFGRIVLGGSLLDARGASVPAEFVLLTENRVWKIYSVDLSISRKTLDLPPDNPILLERTFRERGLGYVMKYPQDWKVDLTADFVATFEPAFASDAAEGMVIVRNIQAASAEQVEEDLIAQYIALSTLSSYRDQEDYVYTLEGEVDLAGRELIIEYPENGREWRQWVVIIPRRGQELVHVWSYANTIDEYRDHLPLAEAMFATWEIGQEIGQDIE